jgi:hypothetical protein
MVDLNNLKSKNIYKCVNYDTNPKDIGYHIFKAMNTSKPFKYSNNSMTLILRVQ